MIVYDFRGLGAMRAVYTLSPDVFCVELPGVQMGKILHEVRIPVHDIHGFYVKGATRYVGGGPRSALQAVALNSMNDFARMQKGQLLLSYSIGGKKKSKRFTMLEANAPEFQALIRELVRLRPEADLRRMPEAKALDRLGMWSPQKISLVAVLVVTLVAGLIAGLAVVAQRL